MEPHAQIDALSCPKAYPDRPSRISMCQTHISGLFFTERFVYKVKKPVDFGFLDFTTLAARKFCCDEEVRLNRQLAPQVYLGVEVKAHEVPPPQHLRVDTTQALALVAEVVARQLRPGGELPLRSSYPATKTDPRTYGAQLAVSGTPRSKPRERFTSRIAAR